MLTWGTMHWEWYSLVLLPLNKINFLGITVYHLEPFIFKKMWRVRTPFFIIPCSIVFCYQGDFPTSLEIFCILILYL